MKVSLVFVGLALCIACVWGEDCKAVSDCSLETCSGDGWTSACQRGTCTCSHATHTGAQCLNSVDCGSTQCHLGIGHGSFDRFLKPHCIDNHCTCTPSFGGGGK